MDANRFDRLSRAMANRMSRRGAVRALGGGGLATVAMAGPVLHLSDGAAQTDAEPCELDLVATVRVGASAGAALGGDALGELSGRLRFTTTSSGELSDTVLDLEDGASLEALGQIDGHAITLRVQVPPGGTVVLVGAGEERISSCDGAVDGLFSGPAPGDIGDWHGTLSRISASSLTAQSTMPADADSLGCQATGLSCLSAAECCSSPAVSPDCVNGVCQCSRLLVDCSPGDGIDCCDDLICVDANCCIPDGTPCMLSLQCCNFCLNGVCSQTPPACLPVGDACSSIPCCPPAVCGGELCILPACADLGASCAQLPCCDPAASCVSGQCQIPCALAGGPCDQHPCCDPNWCDFQDGPGVCRCEAPGESCAGVGTGGCCSGLPCNAEGICP